MLTPNSHIRYEFEKSQNQCKEASDIPRTSRMLVSDEKAVYHVMSRTALDGFPLADVEKEFMLVLIKRLAAQYFTEILGFCLMGNHFHLLVKMLPDSRFTDSDIKTLIEAFHGKERDYADERILYWRNKLSKLSEFMREIKKNSGQVNNTCRTSA